MQFTSQESKSLQIFTVHVHWLMLTYRMKVFILLMYNFVYYEGFNKMVITISFCEVFDFQRNSTEFPSILCEFVCNIDRVKYCRQNTV